jgi:hypothetical protein
MAGIDTNASSDARGGSSLALIQEHVVKGVQRFSPGRFGAFLAFPPFKVDSLKKQLACASVLAPNGLFGASTASEHTCLDEQWLESA